MASIDHCVSFFIELSLKYKPAFLCFFKLEITVFSRIFKIPKIPVARLSSVRRANPFLIDSRALRFFTTLPSNLIVPECLVAIPKIFSNVSVRPLPSKPAIPTISPFLTLKDTSFRIEYCAVRPSTSNAMSPGLFVFGGNWFVSSRPTISLMISSIERSSADSVATHVPSRMIVISSEILLISAIL